MKKDKILFIKNSSIKNSIDGIDKILLNFAKYNFTNNLNYELYFLFNKKCICSEKIARYGNVKVISYPEFSYKSLIKNFFKFLLAIKYLKSINAEYIIETNPYHYSLTKFLKHNTKLVNFFLGLKPSPMNKFLPKPFSKIFSKLYTNQFRKRDLFIVQTSQAKKQILSYGVEPKKIKLLKTGFPDISKKEELKIKKSSIHKSIINKSKINIIGVGRLGKRKGGEDFCKLAKICNDQNLNFIYIGVLKNEKEIEFYEDHKKYVKFTGHSDQVMEILMQSDIAIHLSHEEASSLILREMMFAGLPIIAWDVPTINSDLNHQKNLLIKKGNFNLAKKKLYKLIESKSLTLEIANNNKKISRIYTMENMFLKFLDLIKKIQ